MNLALLSVFEDMLVPNVKKFARSSTSSLHPDHRHKQATEIQQVLLTITHYSLNCVFNVTNDLRFKFTIVMTQINRNNIDRPLLKPYEDVVIVHEPLLLRV